MSSQVGSSSSSLVVLPSIEESSGSKSADVPVEATASITLCSSEDEATLCLNLFSNTEKGNWGARFLITFEIYVPSCNDRAYYPPRDYQCTYQDALEASLRIPPHPFIIALMNFFQLGLGKIVPNAWCLVVSFLVLALRDKITPSVELFNLFFKISSHPGKNSWHYFRGREGRSLVSNPVSSVKEWKGKFAFIKVEGLERS